MAKLRPATPEDVPGLRCLGEVVLPATYGPIDPALSAVILDGWWAVDRIAEQVERLPHVAAERDGETVGMANLGRGGFREVERVPNPPYPDDVWMRKDLS